MRIEFSKYEALGKDFILVEQALTEQEAVALCDRHRGVGADGVLVVTPSAENAFAMRTFDSNGASPETTGSGIRCAALHLARTGRVEVERAFEIDTHAGPHTCRVRDAGDTGMVEVLMPPASLAPREMGVASSKALIDTPIDIGAELIDVHTDPLRVTVVSIGNPHAITFDDLLDTQVKRLGPMVEKHPLFPRGANAGFAKMTGRWSMDLRVFKRGIGWTNSCGTCACAAAVAAVATARAPSGEPIEVRLPGGPLTVTVSERGARIEMTGPARHVFDSAIEV